MKLKAILKIIETGLQSVEISFTKDDWRMTVPPKPGWYFYQTDTPIEILKNVGPPVGERHYNIPNKILESMALKKYDAVILPQNKSLYIVYSGEAKNLKARAREHISGHPKTGCLALANYDSLHSYNWNFNFTLCPSSEDSNSSKLLRTLGEQAWRAKYGWPVLCGK